MVSYIEYKGMFEYSNERRRNMLFTSPAFMFLFLPISLIFCVLFGKNRKRLCMGIVSVIYYIFMYMDKPLNLIWLPLLVLYAYFAAHMLDIKRNRLVSALVGAVPVIWLILMRCVAYYGTSDFVYPVGITLPALCAAAYIWDVAYGDEPEYNIARLGMYLTFFPMMLVGPFIGYSRFIELTDDKNMGITLSRCASGIKCFVLGFIKRIAVGAVLIDGYEKIFAYSWDAPNLAIMLLLLVLIYFGVYFSLVGYYDMAIGISRMYGVDMPEIKANPLKTATVNEYSKSLFGSIREWASKYIICPIQEKRGKQIPPVAKICIICTCAVVFVRAELSVLLLTVPLIAFSAASARLKLDKQSGGGRTGLRVIFGVLMMLVMGAFWVFITMLGSPWLLEYIGEITFENAEYQTDMVLTSFSGIKYAFVTLLACITLLPQTNWVGRLYDRLGKRMRAVIDYGTLPVLLILFVFSLIFFLPQFEQYNTVPFMYITI